MCTYIGHTPKHACELSHFCTPAKHPSRAATYPDMLRNTGALSLRPCHCVPRSLLVHLTVHCPHPPPPAGYNSIVPGGLGPAQVCQGRAIRADSGARSLDSAPRYSLRRLAQLPA